MQRYKAPFMAGCDINTLREALRKQGAQGLYLCDRENAIYFLSDRTGVDAEVSKLTGKPVMLAED